MLPLAALVVAAFAISFAVARDGEADDPPRQAAVPGVTPEPVGPGSTPRIATLGAAAALPPLRARPRPASPAPAPAPVAAPAPAAPDPEPVTPAPSPQPVGPAPRPVQPQPAPQPREPAGERFRSER